MKLWIIVGAVVGVLCAGLLYAIVSPYVVVNTMQQAMTANDADTLAEYIDFPQVRQNMKDQLNAAMLQNMTESESDNPFAAFGLVLGGAFVEQIVDAVVTPAGLMRLMHDGEIDPQATPDTSADAETIVQMAYQSWDRFTVDITVPSNGNTITIVLHRNGLWEWLVTEIRLPLMP